MRTILSSLALLTALALPAAAERLDLDYGGGGYVLFEEQPGGGTKATFEFGSRRGHAAFTYTSLDLDRCEVHPDSEAGWAQWRCGGLTEDWPVHVEQDDLRFTVSYGPNGRDEPAAQQRLGGFYRIHDTLEWVTAGESPGDLKPVATILRFFLEIGTDTANQYEHPILVVTQIKPGAVCHIAYIDARANEKANLDARAAALRLAGSHNCEAEPELIGPQSAGVFAE